MDTEINPIKLKGSDNNIYPGKIDPPTIKKIPIEVGIPELLVKMAAACNSPCQKATADLTLVISYYLL